MCVCVFCRAAQRGCWLLVVCCLLLVVGCWLLVGGCWLLLLACCLLVVLFCSLVLNNARGCERAQAGTLPQNMLLKSMALQGAANTFFVFVVLFVSFPSAKVPTLPENMLPKNMAPQGSYHVFLCCLFVCRFFPRPNFLLFLLIFGGF